MSVFLGQNCLHLTFLPYLSSETYSLKYKKLPNIVFHACENITEKRNLLEMHGPQIQLCLFTFGPIVSIQFKRLTTIDILSWFSVVEVTHPHWVREVPGSIPGSSKGFYVWFFFFVVVFFLFCPKTHYLSQKFAIPFTMLIY